MPEEKIIEKAVSRNLQHRIIEPEEVAAMAVFLASEDARGITGQALNICGGLVFH
jgi:NAD(P)-dependent dehydrogenase (short-subunit alcohol dehydrogenase family)